jgi:hypothetical protein
MHSCIRLQHRFIYPFGLHRHPHPDHKANSCGNPEHLKYFPFCPFHFVIIKELFIFKSGEEKQNYLKPAKAGTGNVHDEPACKKFTPVSRSLWV